VRRFFTPGWLGIHLIAIVLFFTFLWFGWWQYERASAGNARSWGYTFEWPVFAIFVIVMWIKMIRDEIKSPGGKGASAEAEPVVPKTEAELIKEAEEEDPRLAAYNRRLARLNSQRR
jgi:DNA-binding transcriptional regulator of glucitol operon